MYVQTMFLIIQPQKSELNFFTFPFGGTILKLRNDCTIYFRFAVKLKQNTLKNFKIKNQKLEFYLPKVQPPDNK